MVSIRSGPRNMIRYISAGLVLPGFLSLMLIACSGDGLTDIEEILIDGPTVVDINARSATLIATTNIDVACSVAYGPTTEYGQLAVDQDMAGGGHVDHQPFLRNLQPNTLYHYMLSGTGTDGVIYRSADYTFRTPPEETTGQSPASENLALISNGARVVGTSSVYGDGGNDGAWGGNNAIDGNPSTEWSTAGDGDGAWIEIEFPVIIRAESVGLRTRTMGTSAQIRTFQVIGDSGEIAGPLSLGDAASVYRFPIDMKTKKLRIEAVDTTGGNTGVVDIEVFGLPVP